MEYGTDRISDLLEAPAAARDSADILIGDLVSFCGAAPQHDDLTVMVVRRSD